MENNTNHIFDNLYDLNNSTDELIPKGYESSNSEFEYLKSITIAKFPRSSECFSNMGEPNLNITDESNDNSILENQYGSNKIIKMRFNRNTTKAESETKVKEFLQSEDNITAVIAVFFDPISNKTVRYNITKSKEKIQTLNLSPNSKKIRKNKMSMENITKSNNPQKNGPKLFGKAIIAFIYDSSNKGIIEQIIIKNTPENSQHNCKIGNLLNWIQKKRLSEDFNKIVTFKKFWLVQKQKNTMENILSNTFRDVCLYFFKNKGARFIFSKFAGNGTKSLKLENACAYLGLIPVFIRGVLDPVNFNSLKMPLT